MNHNQSNEPSAVLVVENDVVERVVTSAELRRHGFKVFEAGNTAEAKTILKAVAVDVLFSNASLIDGDHLARWIKRQRLRTRTFWVASAGAPPVKQQLCS